MVLKIIYIPNYGSLIDQLRMHIRTHKNAHKNAYKNGLNDMKPAIPCDTCLIVIVEFYNVIDL